MSEHLEPGQMVALYGGEGGRGIITKASEMGTTHLVRFTDGAEVWCAAKNLTPVGRVEPLPATPAAVSGGAEIINFLAAYDAARSVMSHEEILGALKGDES